MDRKENNATYYALRIDTRHRKQAYQSNGETAREMRGKNRLVHRFVRTAAFPGHKSANSPRSNRYIPALFSAAIVPTLNDPPTSSFARKKKNPFHPFPTIRVTSRGNSSSSSQKHESPSFLSFVHRTTSFRKRSSFYGKFVQIFLPNERQKFLFRLGDRIERR